MRKEASDVDDAVRVGLFCFAALFALVETALVLRLGRGEDGDVMDFGDFMVMNLVAALACAIVSCLVGVAYQAQGLAAALWPVYFAGILGVKWALWNVWIKPRLDARAAKERELARMKGEIARTESARAKGGKKGDGGRTRVETYY